MTAGRTGTPPLLIAVALATLAAAPVLAKPRKAPAKVAKPLEIPLDPRVARLVGPGGWEVLQAPAAVEFVRFAGAEHEVTKGEPLVAGRALEGAPVRAAPDQVPRLIRRLRDVRNWKMPLEAVSEGALPLEEEKLCTFAPTVALRISGSKKGVEPLELVFDFRCSQVERVPTPSEQKRVRKAQSTFDHYSLDLGAGAAAWLADFRAAFPGDAALAAAVVRDELPKTLERIRKIDDLSVFTVLRGPDERLSHERWLAVGKEKQAGDGYELTSDARESDETVRDVAQTLLTEPGLWANAPDDACTSPAAYALRFDAGSKRGRSEVIDVLVSPECQRLDLAVTRTLHEAWRDSHHVASAKFTEKAVWRLLAEAFPDALEFDSAVFEAAGKPAAAE